MYSVMWSEHCSYKSSRPHLGRFPSQAPWVVVGPGENAGVIDLGDGWLAAFRIESHNHPSFVEPHQGAATGVGGILRDVFTMGARPIAVWDQIRFGSLEDPHNRYLLAGVVAGIAGYGNAVGVPTVGGEVAFEDCYAGNPLVNVMALGILRREQLVLAESGSEGTEAVLLGSATGRDGIGGASVLASAGFDDSSSAKRPSVQVGDPFEEKKLIEACLELYERGLVVGIQDLGAAGLSCATSEPSAKSGMGMEVELGRVHVREPGMTPAELLMSESQERMMAFVAPADVEEVLAVAAKWEIDASRIGTVSPGGLLRVFENGELVAEVPAASLSEEAPVLHRPLQRPDWLDDLWAQRPLSDPTHVAADLLHMLDEPSLADPAWIYQQYDHMLFLNTVIGPGHDGTLLRIKGTTKALAGTTDGNGRRCYLDPRRGAARLVYEAALNVAVTGAQPLAVVDNLNFGNPEKPEVMWQFAETVDGISDACEHLGIPVVGGNVSFYNETDGIDIYATPIVGLIGLADPYPQRPPRLDRAESGMDFWLIGPDSSDDIAGSAYQKMRTGTVNGRPSKPDPDMAVRLTTLATRLAADEITPVLHDVSEGGLAMAVAKVSIISGVGITVDWTGNPFAEDPHRLIAAVHAQQADRLRGMAGEAGVTARRVGSFGGDEIRLGSAVVDLGEATVVWRNALPRRMG